MSKMSAFFLAAAFFVPFASASEKDVVERLKTMRISQVRYVDAPVGDVVRDLRRRSAQLDPAGRPANINLALSEGLDPKKITVTLELENIPLYKVLRYAAMSAGLNLMVERGSLFITDRKVPESRMETRVINARPGTVSSLFRLLGKRETEKE